MEVAPKERRSERGKKAVIRHDENTPASLRLAAESQGERAGRRQMSAIRARSCL